MKTKKILSLLAGTDSRTIPCLGLVARLTIAVVIWPHGAQLLAGWFGGPGFGDAMDYLTGIQGLPWLLALLVILIQFFSSIFLALGFFTRLNALFMFIIGTGMIFSGHTENGFFMNWQGNQAGEGFEYHLLLLGLCIITMLTGGGRYSADAMLFPKKISQ